MVAAAPVVSTARRLMPDGDSGSSPMLPSYRPPNSRRVWA
jgi:hypothetical protein